MSTLACPRTHQPLLPAPPERVSELQQAQSQRALRDVAGNLVTEPFDGAWQTADACWVYLRRGAVSDLRPDAAIVVTPLAAA